jgi:hypothetical protein
MRIRVGSEESKRVEKVKKIVPKPKKEKPKPTEYKRGVWNPDVELITSEPSKESTSSNIDTNCCTRCNCRNIIRACMVGNADLLKKCVNNVKEITNLGAIWGPDM